MTRHQAIAHAQESFDSGSFQQTLARRIAIRTESQNPERAGVLRQYLDTEIGPAFEAMGFTCQILQHPKALAPFLFAQCLEDPALPFSVMAMAMSSAASKPNGRTACRHGR